MYQAIVLQVVLAEELAELMKEVKNALVLPRREPQTMEQQALRSLVEPLVSLIHLLVVPSVRERQLLAVA